jgi:CRP-like cAMP-binding protein
MNQRAATFGYPRANHSMPFLCDVSQLRKSSVFAALDDKELGRLLSVAQPEQVLAGAVIVPQSMPVENLLVVLSGTAKAVMTHSEGREVTLQMLRPGDLIAETSLLDGSPTTASVIALSDVQLLSVPRGAFVQLLAAHPELSIRLLSDLASRMRRAEETIFALALQDIEERLCRMLLRLARDERSPDQQGGLLLRRRPTQQELANMVGATRESVSRCLTALAKQGLAVCQGRSMLLTQRLLRRMTTKATG